MIVIFEAAYREAAEAVDSGDSSIAAGVLYEFNMPYPPQPTST